MRLMVFLALFCASIFSSFSAYAAVEDDIVEVESRDGKGIITGQILDESDLPLPGAVIKVNNTSKGASTDVNGRFTIPGLDASQREYEITISYIGYEPVVKKVTLNNRNVANVTVKLQDNIVLDEVIVTGTSGGSLRALNVQKTSNRVMNVISADQVGQFPDPNIGDALKRISGVHVQYDQGEAKLVSIRGTDPSKSTIAINGSSMPGTGDNRAVGVDAIPADMVQTIELSKTITPDMDGDAIGGAVNLVTRKAPYKRILNVSLGTGMTFLTRGLQWNGAFTYGERFFNDKLGLMFSSSVYKQSFGSNDQRSPWEMTQLGKEEIFIPKNFTIEQTLMDRLRISNTLGLDYVINERHKITFTGIYNDYKDWRKRYNLIIDDLGGDYKENWKKAPGFEDVVIYKDKEDFEDSDSLVKVLDENNDGVDDVTGKMYVDFDRETPTIYPELERHVLAGANKNGGELTHKQIVNGALGGEHLFNRLKMDWHASVIKATENQPDLRDFELQSSNEKTVVMDYRDPRSILVSSGFELENILEEVKGKDSKEAAKIDTWELDGFKGKIGKSETIQQDYQANFEIPLNEGAYKSILKFGAKARMMQKDKKIIGRVKWKPAWDPQFLPDEEVNNWAWMWQNFGENMKNVSAAFVNSKYTVGNVVDAKWVASQDTDPFKDTKYWRINNVYNNEMADGYDAIENIYSGYLMATQNIGEKFSIIAGLRMEATNIEYAGTEYIDRADITKPVSVTSNYMSWLPGLHFRWTPTGNTVFRLAYARTISRPSYRDLVPYTKTKIKNAQLSFGNPELKPTLSDNIDLLGEWYTGAIGLISGGVYFKNIKDFRTTNYYEMPWEEASKYLPTIEQVENNPNADPNSVKDYIKNYKKVQGKPFEVDQPMNGGDAKLLGVEIAIQRNLGFIADFLRPFSFYANYTHNWVFQNEEDAQLTGTANNIGNVSLSFETKKINARLSLNMTSDFLIGTGPDATRYRYYDDVAYLDANMDYFVTDRFTISLSANNLLNEVQRVYQWKKDYTVSELSNGARVQLGLKYRIF